MSSVKVLFVYRGARKKIFDDVKKKHLPDHLLYGANYLSQSGIKIVFSDIAYSKVNILFWLLLPIQYLLINLTSIGFKLDQAILLIPKFRSSDVIVSTADSVGLPILFLKKLKIIDKPIIYISTGLINELEFRRKSLIFKIYAGLLKQAETIVCHSKIESYLYNKYIPSQKRKIVFIPFGIDIKFFKTKKENENFIFSVGRDKSRDYKFLAYVAKKLENEKFVLVTSMSNINNINFPPNVKVYFDLPYTKVRDFYVKSKLVFIPLKEINRASGQITFLESLAANKKVVAAKIKGIFDVYPELVLKNNVCLFKANNINSATDSIKKMLIHNNRPKPLDDMYSSKNYSKKIAVLINSYR